MSKVDHIQSNSNAELMFQTRSLDKIVNINGTVTVLDNPSLCSEVLECIGKHLHAFWKINSSKSELVVIEFLFNSATLYNPQNGTKITISFAGE
jgi:general stress protein 26